MSIEEIKNNINQYVDDASITAKIKTKFIEEDLIQSLSVHYSRCKV